MYAVGMGKPAFDQIGSFQPLLGREITEGTVVGVAGAGAVRVPAAGGKALGRRAEDEVGLEGLQLGAAVGGKVASRIDYPADRPGQRWRRENAGAEDTCGSGSEDSSGGGTGVSTDGPVVGLGKAVSGANRRCLPRRLCRRQPCGRMAGHSVSGLSGGRRYMSSGWGRRDPKSAETHDEHSNCIGFCQSQMVLRRFFLCRGCSFQKLTSCKMELARATSRCWHSWTDREKVEE